MTSSAYATEYRERLRKQVFDHYGWTCVCCNSVSCLSIDHINGDGAKHRAQIGSNSARLYRWLIANNYPPGFQVLCKPCNSSKGTSTQCILHIPLKVELGRRAYYRARRPPTSAVDRTREFDKFVKTWSMQLSEWIAVNIDHDKPVYRNVPQLTELGERVCLELRKSSYREENSK
jgi:hypothetical protein